MIRGALFGPEDKPDQPYRYQLWRQWADPRQRVVWIMLNPSTADALKDDPTISKCIEFSRRWGFGAMDVVNLFGMRSTNPLVLRRAHDPIGADNDKYILDSVGRSQRVVCAWGNHGWLHGRDAIVKNLLAKYAEDKTVCLGLTSNSRPKHPLARGKSFIPYEFEPQPYST